MKICLLVNEDAGSAVSTGDLRSAIERGGHELVHVVSTDNQLTHVLDEGIDLLAAAGGDGTIRHAASALVGRAIPLAMLPMGTANNIAQSLGIDGPIEQLIEKWHGGQCRPLDLGVLHGPAGTERFIEGAGAGLVPSGIAAMDAKPGSDDGDADERVHHALREYRRVLSDLRPQRWSLTVDGARLEEDLLLLEVLNIGSVGPNLALSQEADASDGWLSVVTAGEAHERQIADYLHARIDGRQAPPLDLPVRRARVVEIQGVDRLHVDGDIQRCTPDQVVSIRVQTAAVRIVI
jgi:diacylglycerol kinase (ATP)